MRQRIWVALAGAIAFAATGCSSDSPTTTAPSPSPVPVAQKPATQNFNQPTVNQKLPPPPNAIPGLIQSTNGEERAKQVQAGIQATKTQRDPFKSIPPAVTITTLPSPTAAGGSSSVPATPPAPSVASAPPRPTSPFPSNSGVRSGSLPLNAPNTANRTPSSVPNAASRTPSIAALPPLPSANLANAVQVTGVVQVGGVPQAIIKAPNESTSRYVSTGQRLVNGQVLVKRIVVYNGGATPVVILEENGIEVAKAVGDTGPRVAGPA